MEALLTVPVGLAVGLHTATWGMFKDAPHEGFAWSTFLRSPVLAVVIAAGLVLFGGLAPPVSAPAALLLFAVTYGIERMLVEFYKTFLRDEDQSKYTIPMQFSVRGRVVESSAIRLGVGALYLSAEIGLLAGLWWLERHGPELGLVGTALVAGSAGGWGSAFGGAWKDAPVEGFQLLKFFRSPLIAFLYGLLMATLTSSYVAVFLGAIGLTVATTETYKTFFFPNEDRGKFMGKTPRHPEMMRRRYRFVPLYVAVWLGVLTAVVLTLTGVAGGGTA